ncbi:hypothetical protein [Brevibacillus sp. MER 51]|nr:hypothetical protein [Brevibacillus sp. MER 51]
MTEKQIIETLATKVMGWELGNKGKRLELTPKHSQCVASGGED